MSAGHTPGPWVARECPHQAGSPDPEWEVFVEDPDCFADGEMFVADICSGVLGRQEANARLIAAAPDLFDFVLAHSKRNPVFAKGHDKQLIADAKALIARATGAAA